MSDLKTEFEAAAAHAKTFTKQPSNEEKLTLYAYYKQATVGDNDTAKPGMMDFTGKAKWAAWDEKKGVSTEEAMQKYIEEINKQKALYA